MKMLLPTNSLQIARVLLFFILLCQLALLPAVAKGKFDDDIVRNERLTLEVIKPRDVLLAEKEEFAKQLNRIFQVPPDITQISIDRVENSGKLHCKPIFRCLDGVERYIDQTLGNKEALEALYHDLGILGWRYRDPRKAKVDLRKELGIKKSILGEQAARSKKKGGGDQKQAAKKEELEKARMSGEITQGDIDEAIGEDNSSSAGIIAAVVVIALVLCCVCCCCCACGGGYYRHSMKEESLADKKKKMANGHEMKKMPRNNGYNQQQKRDQTNQLANSATSLNMNMNMGKGNSAQMSNNNSNLLSNTCLLSGNPGSLNRTTSHLGMAPSTGLGGMSNINVNNKSQSGLLFPGSTNLTSSMNPIGNNSNSTSNLLGFSNQSLVGNNMGGFNNMALSSSNLLGNNPSLNRTSNTNGFQGGFGMSNNLGSIGGTTPGMGTAMGMGCVNPMPMPQNSLTRSQSSFTGGLGGINNNFKRP